MKKGGKSASAAKRWTQFRDDVMLGLLMSSEKEGALFIQKKNLTAI